MKKECKPSPLSGKTSRWGGIGWRMLCVVWLLCSTSFLFAQQKQTFTIEFKANTLEEVFAYFGKNSDYVFTFNSNDLKQNPTRVTRSFTDATLSAILTECLKGTPFTFEIIDRHVVIKKREQVQQKSLTVKGFVYDEKKQPMPGVTVQVIGTTVGTATTENGWFAITLPMLKGKLKFSFVGYLDQEVEFSDKTDTLKIYMKENVQELDEAVVVAYGETTRRKATGSISSVKADEIKGIPSGNIANLLQGRVAGMDIINMSGAPGGGGTAVIIRGYNSLDVEAERRYSNPLWVVDGVPLNSFTSPITGTNLLADINPDMIESVQVLKDASAASIYGSRAANGVIIVTTKKGRKNQKATFSLNVSQSWSILPELPTVTTGRMERLFRLEAIRKTYQGYLDPETNTYKYPTSLREQYDYYSKGASFDGNFIPMPYSTDNGTMFQDSLNSFYNNSTNYFPIYWRTGKVTNANIQTYGGAERMTYAIGLGYYSETGIFRGTGYNRVDLNSFMNVTPIERLSVDLRLNATVTKRKRGTKIGVLGSAPSIETVPGEPYKLSTLLPGEGSVAWESVLDAYNGTEEKNRGVRLRANFKLGYDILDGLNLSTSLAADYSIERRNYFQPSYLSYDGYSNTIGETGINLMILNENLLSFKRTINEKHDISFVAGFSYQYDQMEYNGGNAQNAPSDKIHYAPSGMPEYGEQTSGDYTEIIPFQHYQSDMQEKILLSYFARLEYSYLNKYLLSMSFRRDGSSTFGANHRWGTFPSVAAAWTFSEERWIKENLGWLSFGKLRASWGCSGMHFAQPYLALGVMNVGSTSYIGNATIEPVWSDGLLNPDLSWEETEQYDFGLDLDLFEHRLSFTLDYYYRYTDKLLAAINLSGVHTGYQSQWRNAGAISNEGVEFMLRYDIFRKSELYWKISFNGAKNWNRFEKSYDGKDFDGRIIGKPLNGIYTYQTEGFISSQDEVPCYHDQTGALYYLSQAAYMKEQFLKPGDYNFIDVNGDTYIDYNDLIYMGSTLPQINGGVVNEFRWKNLDINISCSYSLGRHIVNRCIKRTFIGGSYNSFVFDIIHTDFWDNPEENAIYPMWQYERMHRSETVDLDVEKVNYLKLKTLVVGYSLPKDWTEKVRISELRFFVSAENLLTWTNYSGLDPEIVDVSTGIDGQDSYPLSRKYTIGLTLKF